MTDEEAELNRAEIWMVVDAINFCVARSTCEQVEKINKTRYKILGVPQPNDPLAKHCSHLGEWGKPAYDTIIKKLTKQSKDIDERSGLYSKEK
tara:strand:+ start:504 stop:782 length:279 start_codon:yes stop_codon:yes gene_type:complete